MSTAMTADPGGSTLQRRSLDERPERPGTGPSRDGFDRDAADDGTARRPVTVLHVIEALQGGPASYMREILPAQRQALGARNIGLIIPREQADELPGLDGMNVGYFRGRRLRALHIPILAWQTLRWVRRHRPSVVHAQGTFAGIAVRLGLSLLREPPKIVYCAHGWAFDRRCAPWKARLIALVERGLARHCDSIVCISQHDYRSGLKSGIARARLVEIRNALSDPPPASPDCEPVSWPAGRRRFLFVGRFDHQKGVDVFLQAMRALGDDVFAYAVGSPVVGRPMPLDAPSNVVFTGWLPRERVLDYIASAEVVVVPSRWEGFGLAALEAMRAGRVLIASRVGGLPELIRHGNTGLLVPPESVAELSAAMRDALRMNLASMGDRARRRYERAYHADRLNAELLALYQRLLADRAPRPRLSAPVHDRAPGGLGTPSAGPWRTAAASARHWPGSR